MRAASRSRSRSNLRVQEGEQRLLIEGRRGLQHKAPETGSGIMNGKIDEEQEDVVDYSIMDENNIDPMENNTTNNTNKNTTNYIKINGQENHINHWSDITSLVIVFLPNFHVNGIPFPSLQSSVERYLTVRRVFGPLTNQYIAITLFLEGRPSEGESETMTTHQTYGNKEGNSLQKELVSKLDRTRFLIRAVALAAANEAEEEADEEEANEEADNYNGQDEEEQQQQQHEQAPQPQQPHLQVDENPANLQEQRDEEEEEPIHSLTNLRALLCDTDIWEVTLARELEDRLEKCSSSTSMERSSLDGSSTISTSTTSSDEHDCSCEHHLRGPARRRTRSRTPILGRRVPRTSSSWILGHHPRRACGARSKSAA
ncbi:unnamed protein product [Amoebophrya sp. A25]|nr:unnamed protein product [Amoebophrya sp. A25]|eukprot:GSA25T00014769001.1